MPIRKVISGKTTKYGIPQSELKALDAIRKKDTYSVGRGEHPGVWRMVYVSLTSQKGEEPVASFVKNTDEFIKQLVYHNEAEALADAAAKTQSQLKDPRATSLFFPIEIGAEATNFQLCGAKLQEAFSSAKTRMKDACKVLMEHVRKRDEALEKIRRGDY